ncbi:dehydrogenase [Micromonospora humidisoli]|uniref:NAD(P)-dependent oxidoreductase n=1 Tax=unclassified Micromonospora TaxID=2617518 RepID=UPI0022BC6FF6|nr:NAD(P)-dependent oxidoreductase [Micromonospora sp. AKA109]GHJ07040.1 dehydrogenase [Micromonospora sp. AKA109]
MTDELTVGVLGTGIMGAAMAGNLVRAGHVVRVWNRSPDKAAATGATVADTPADAVRDADVIITMLYDGAAVRDVIGRAAPGLRPGAAWLQTTTVGLADTAGLAEVAAGHGVAFYDAPVLGTRQPAEAGQLTVLAAGPQTGRERLAAVFDAIASRVVWLGEDGARGDGTRLKLVANSWVLTVTHGAVEMLALAGALGVDPDRFFAVIEGGPLDMGYLHAKTDLVRQGRLSPASFAVETAEKDARLIVAAGEEHGVRLDVLAAGAERFRRAAAQGHGDEDMAASYHASFVP